MWNRLIFNFYKSYLLSAYYMPDSVLDTEQYVVHYVAHNSGKKIINNKIIK